MTTKNEEVRSLTQRLHAAYKDAKNPVPKGYNSHQRFEFVSFAQLTDPIRKLCHKHGIVIVPSIDHIEQTEVEGKRKGWRVVLTMSFTLLNADDGQDRLHMTFMGEAVDYGDKAVNKATTAATKQALMKLFMLSSGDDDPDAEDPSQYMEHSESTWKAENRKFRALCGALQSEAALTLCKMVGATSFADVGVGDIMAMNRKLEAVPEDKREAKLLDWIGNIAPETIEGGARG